MKYTSGRNKRLAVFEDGTFCRLVSFPMKMYSKFGQPKWILVSHLNVEIGRKMANGQLLFLGLYASILLWESFHSYDKSVTAQTMRLYDIASVLLHTQLTMCYYGVSDHHTVAMWKNLWCVV